MYLSAKDIATSRDQTLNNLLGLSSNYLQANQRLVELMTSVSRDSVQHASRHWATLGHGHVESLVQFPAALWLDALARSNQLLESASTILGETHKAMIRNAEAQVKVFDDIVFATIRHAEKSSPWEAEIVLNTLKTTLQGAEQTLHGMSTAAIESVDLAEKEVQQISQTLAESKPRQKRSAARNSSTDTP